MNKLISYPFLLLVQQVQQVLKVQLVQQVQFLLVDLVHLVSLVYLVFQLLLLVLVHHGFLLVLEVLFLLGDQGFLLFRPHLNFHKINLC